MKRIGYLFLLLLITVVPLRAGGHGVVDSIVKAPIVPGGNIAQGNTEFVINLDIPMDPNVPGHALAQDETVKIFLPRSFRNECGGPSGGLDEDCFGAALAVCAPSAGDCNTGVLLQGWPQHPIGPPVAKYDISFDPADHAVVFTALENLNPNVPAAPGMKQIHLILNTFRNPKAGRYSVRVEIGNGSPESGVGHLRILRRVRPSINVTSVFNDASPLPPNPNPIFQEIAAGLDPLPYDFLLFNRKGEPFLDVDIGPLPYGGSYASGIWLLRQGHRVVGHVFVKTPSGADPQFTSPMGASFGINAPLSGVPTARLNVQFSPGLTPGVYKAKFVLRGGNSAVMQVTVN